MTDLEKIKAYTEGYRAFRPNAECGPNQSLLAYAKGLSDAAQSIFDFVCMLERENAGK